MPRPGEEGHWRNFASSRRIAWKTGTSWGLRDGWAVGNSSRYTVGVWVGNASGEGRPGLTGSAMAAPLMFALFNALPASDWFDMPDARAAPHRHLRKRRLSRDRRPAPRRAPGCRSDSHFDALSPSQPARAISTPRANNAWTATASRPAAMTHASWFVLPPAEEFYYRRVARGVPPAAGAARGLLRRHVAGRPALALLYPDPNSQVLIPRELDGSRGRTVFEAVHRRREATIYWHLDDRYLGETHTFHQQSLDIDPGEHILTVVDDEGERVARRFQVIATRKGL